MMINVDIPQKTWDFIHLHIKNKENLKKVLSIFSAVQFAELFELFEGIYSEGWNDGFAGYQGDK